MVRCVPHINGSRLDLGTKQKFWRSVPAHDMISDICSFRQEHKNTQLYWPHFISTHPLVFGRPNYIIITNHRHSKSKDVMILSKDCRCHCQISFGRFWASIGWRIYHKVWQMPDLRLPWARLASMGEAAALSSLSQALVPWWSVCHSHKYLSEKKKLSILSTAHLP